MVGVIPEGNTSGVLQETSHERPIWCWRRCRRWSCIDQHRSMIIFGVQLGHRWPSPSGMSLGNLSGHCHEYGAMRHRCSISVAQCVARTKGGGGLQLLDKKLLGSTKFQCFAAVMTVVLVRPHPTNGAQLWPCWQLLCGCWCRGP